MTEPAVLISREGSVGVLTLNRPDKRNCMMPELLDAYGEAAREIAADTSLRAVVVTGKGRCFSAGADLDAGLQKGDAVLPHERSFAMYDPFLATLDIPVPVICAMNGHAVGGGFGLTLLADIRIAKRNAKYGANFARLGLHSGLAISYVLPKLVGLSHASELLYTGRLIDGDAALAMGLVSRSVDEAEVLPQAMALAGEIAAAGPLAVRTMKASMRAGLNAEIREAAMAEAHLQSATLATADATEGTRALLEKRTPDFQGR